MRTHSAIPRELRTDVEALWNYHDMRHEPRPVDVGIGLGSHDLGVATHTANLYRQGLFPLIVFSGANAPTTVERFPRGEAVHYREHVISLGVPDEAIMVETRATNTSENLTNTRDLLATAEITPRSILLTCRPYQQRRAYATCRKVWPEVEVLCSSLPLRLDAYVDSIGDADRVINMLVGDTQRIAVYAQQGFAIEQNIPDHVRTAYQRLVDAGYTRRLVKARPTADRHLIDVHVLLVRDNQVLLTRRRDPNPLFDGLWHLPSGKLDAGESVLDAAVREAEEEVGVTIDAADLQHVHTLHVNGSGREPRLGLFFEARQWTGEPVNREPDKCSAVQWFQVDALPANVIDYPAAGIHAYLAGNSFGVRGWTDSMMSAQA